MKQETHSGDAQKSKHQRCVDAAGHHDCRVRLRDYKALMYGGRATARCERRAMTLRRLCAGGNKAGRTRPGATTMVEKSQARTWEICKGRDGETRCWATGANARGRVRFQFKRTLQPTVTRLAHKLPPDAHDPLLLLYHLPPPPPHPRPHRPTTETAAQPCSQPPRRPLHLVAAPRIITPLTVHIHSPTPSTLGSLHTNGVHILLLLFLVRPALAALAAPAHAAPLVAHHSPGCSRLFGLRRHDPDRPSGCSRCLLDK